MQCLSNQELEGAIALGNQWGHENEDIMGRVWNLHNTCKEQNVHSIKSLITALIIVVLELTITNLINFSSAFNIKDP